MACNHIDHKFPERRETIHVSDKHKKEQKRQEQGIVYFSKEASVPIHDGRYDSQEKAGSRQNAAHRLKADKKQKEVIDSPGSLRLLRLFCYDNSGFLLSHPKEDAQARCV